MVCKTVEDEDLWWVFNADPPNESWTFFMSGFSRMVAFGDFGDLVVDGGIDEKLANKDVPDEVMVIFVSLNSSAIP